MANRYKSMNWKAMAVSVTIAALLVGMVGLNLATLFTGASPTARATTRQIAMSCTTDAATTFHIHPHLHIFINGVEQIIPGDTGLTPGCEHPIHTHKEDADHSTIHIESPEARDFTLGDFFAVWGKTFNPNQILNYKTDLLHTITLTVNDAPSYAYDSQVMHDGDQIVIKYQTAQPAVGNIQVQTEGGGTVQVTPLPVK